MRRTASLAIAGLSLVAAAFVLGCSRQKLVTERDRKEAAHIASEAQFAMTMKEWARAEGLYAKAAQLAPEGDYWVSLGAARVRQNNRAGAKDAYQSALKAFQLESARVQGSPDPWVKQAYVLALLGRKDDAVALIARAAKQFPNAPKVRALTDPKEFEKFISGQKFKDMAL